MLARELRIARAGCIAIRTMAGRTYLSRDLLAFGGVDFRRCVLGLSRRRPSSQGHDNQQGACKHALRSLVCCAQ